MYHVYILRIFTLSLYLSTKMEKNDLDHRTNLKGIEFVIVHILRNNRT